MQSVIIRNKFERAVSNGQTVLRADRVFRSLYLYITSGNGDFILSGNTTGMGYVAVAAVFFAVIAAFLLILTAGGFGAGAADERMLKITIPENLDYDGLFDDLFSKYTRSFELERVKTTNMGTLYELSYSIVLRDEHTTRAFLDELRTRNGNLNIVCGKPVTKEVL